MTLPETLQELSLSLGLRRELSANWGLSAFLRPGLYGDFEEIDGDSFNVPVLLLTSYRESAERTWFFGINANAFSDNPVLPALGVRWQISPDWTFRPWVPAHHAVSGGGSKSADRTRPQRPGRQLPHHGNARRAGPRRASPRQHLPRLQRVSRWFPHGEERGFLVHPRRGSRRADRTRVDFYDRDYELDGSGGFYATLALRGRF